MNNAVLAAIFDTYNTGDYPEEIRSSIDATVDYFVTHFPSMEQDVNL